MENPILSWHVTNVLPHGREVLSVELLENRTPGKCGLLVAVARSAGGERILVGRLCPDDARAFGRFLASAAAIADQRGGDATGITGVRTLPIVSILGRAFVLDERLRQLRSVENPQHAFDLDDPRWA